MSFRSRRGNAACNPGRGTVSLRAVLSRSGLIQPRSPRPRLLLATAWLALATTLASAETLVFEVDLRSGSAGPGQVSGGVWTGNGWQTTGAKDERIVFDAGRPIANGRLEATFTAAELPWASQQGKINYVGLHENPELNQQGFAGDAFYARTGEEKYAFSNVKAAGRTFDRSEPEPRVGSAGQWIADGRTELTVVLEWRDGVAFFTGPDGTRTELPRDVLGADTPIDRLRYAFIGSDRYSHGTVKGLCFKHVRLTDLGPDAPGPERTPLRVSGNGRVLVDGTGRPVFLLADTAWALPMRLTREEAERYLRHRRAQRFNAVTFVLFVTGQNEISARLANVYGDEPFSLKDGLPDPARPRMTPDSDPADAETYDYWDHVDYLIRLTRRLGLYAIVLPTWGSGVAGAYDGQTRDGIVFDAANARSYGRWLAERYRDEPHLLWMLGGDRPARQGEVDYGPVVRAMAAGLQEGAPGCLLSYHSRKGAPQSGAFFHPEPWLAYNSVQEWPDRQLERLGEDWQRAPARPTWLFEGRYEGYWRGNYKAEDWGEWQVRQQAYQTVLAGAFGHVYGHERVFGFGNDDADWTQHLDAPGAGSMTHLARLMNCFQPASVLDRVPDQSLIDGEEGRAGRTASDRISAARTARGNQAVFYTASGRPIRVRLDKLVRAKLFAWWFNPRNGRFHLKAQDTDQQRFFERDIPSGPGAGTREFTPPTRGPGQDWVLVLSAGQGM